MLRRIPSLNDFINEAVIWDDAYGNPTKIHKELQEIVQNAIPKYVLDNIESYGAVWGDESLPVPSNIGKGGGNTTGYVAYKLIEIEFKKPIGKSNVTSMTVGIRKRTSGPGTGYLAINLHASNHGVLLKPVTGEFWAETPEAKLKEMFTKEIESYLK